MIFVHALRRADGRILLRRVAPDSQLPKAYIKLRIALEQVCACARARVTVRCTVRMCSSHVTYAIPASP